MDILSWKKPEMIYRDAREAGGLLDREETVYREMERDKPARVSKAPEDVGKTGAQQYSLLGVTYPGSAYLDRVADTSWEIGGTGDFNWDGKPDILWRNYGTGPIEGSNVVWYMDGKNLISADSVEAVSSNYWTIEAIGDFNGDGKTDILWRYYGTGWAQGYNVLWYMNGATYAGYDYVYAVYDRYWAIVNR